MVLILFPFFILKKGKTSKTPSKYTYSLNFTFFFKKKGQGHSRPGIFLSFSLFLNGIQDLLIFQF